jgi:hypothetical protein
MEFNLEEVVGLISKQPAEFLGTLKTEDGEWKPKDEILAAIKKEDKARLDNVVKGEAGKAVRLRLKQAQNYIRENYGIESDAPEIEDHLKTLVESIKATSGKEKIVEKTVELTEETALQNHIVKNLLKSEVTKTTLELQRQLEDEKKKFQSYIEEDGKKKLDASLYEEALKVLTATKAALSKDETQRQKQIKRFVAGLKTDFNFKLDENGKPYPVDKEGEPLQEGYVEVSFADLIKKENIWDNHNFNPELNSPGANSQPPTQKFAGQIPKDQTALQEALRSLPGEANKAKRAELMTAFEAAQPK